MEISHNKWPLKAIVIPRAKYIDQLILALQNVFYENMLEKTIEEVTFVWK